MLVVESLQPSVIPSAGNHGKTISLPIINLRLHYSGIVLYITLVYCFYAGYY